MELRVLAVGKLRDAGLEACCEEYVKRSRALLPIVRSSLRAQAALWPRAVGGPTVVLDERGTSLDTPGLAQWIADWRAAGRRHVSFLIGDAHGFGEADRARADRVLSLSRLTLPHRLAQVVLVEQLYRAATILAGHPYHHA